MRCVFELAPTCIAHGISTSSWSRPSALPVFPRLWDTCNGLLRDAGVAQTLSRVNAFNRASRRAHERMGPTAHRCRRVSPVGIGAGVAILYPSMGALFPSPAHVPVLAVGSASSGPDEVVQQIAS